jgi:tRNA U34 2-thiouridine synthase MnmA/TrmU
MRNWDSLLSEQAINDNTLDLSYAPSSSSKNGHQCEWERDWADVQATTKHLRIPEERVRMVDFTKEYWTRVFEPAVGVWEGGGTPNPDVDCNR